MHKYFIHTPWIIQKLFPQYVWRLPNKANEVYLTFDDGPHPTITPWVLEQLRLYEAKATFFCLGKNVEAHPGIYAQILAEGHAVGNHTYDHPNGWKTPVAAYVDNIVKASEQIHTSLFRPPYGRIKPAQVAALQKAISNQTKVIMWDVLSCDFDTSVLKEQCVKNVLSNVKSGAIVVFHDSEKAYQNLEYSLPRVLQALRERSFINKGICL